MEDDYLPDAFGPGARAVRTRIAVADRLVVTSEEEIGRLLPVFAAVGAVWERTPAHGLHILKVPRVLNNWEVLDEVQKKLSANPLIDSAEKDYIIFPASSPPDDPNFGQQWALADIEATAAWTICPGDASVIVAVVDSGVDMSHPELAGSIFTNPGEQGFDALGRVKSSNGVDDDGNGFIDDWRGWDFGGADPYSEGDNDPSPLGSSGSHGTRIAGIIAAARNNALGIAGVAPEITILPLKIVIDSSGTAFRSNLIAAQRYLVEIRRLTGRHLVANFSWDLYQNSDSSVYREDIALSAEGIHSVWAAGNAGLNFSDPGYGSFFNTTHQWAGLAGVFAAGASTPSGARRSTSNFGDRAVHLFAPGENILTTELGGGYSTVSGTSYSAPHVAAVVALLRSLYPGLGLEDIKTTLLNQNTPTPALQGLCVADGRLNALAASRAARDQGLASFELRASGIGIGELVSQLRIPLLRTTYSITMESSVDLRGWQTVLPKQELVTPEGDDLLIQQTLPRESGNVFFRARATVP